MRFILEFDRYRHTMSTIGIRLGCNFILFSFGKVSYEISLIVEKI